MRRAVVGAWMLFPANHHRVVRELEFPRQQEEVALRATPSVVPLLHHVASRSTAAANKQRDTTNRTTHINQAIAMQEAVSWNIGQRRGVRRFYP